MTTDLTPSPQFECKACQGTVPLDDVQLLMSDGRRCLCFRCWLAATVKPKPGETREPAPAEPSIPEDGHLYLKWWCTTCREARVLPLRNMRRPHCAVCDAPLRRWDEQWRPRGTDGGRE